MRFTNILVLLALLTLPVACGGGGGGGGGDRGDETPPAAITDLAVTGLDDPGRVELSWSASGDDGLRGTASSYVLACSTDLALVTGFDGAVTQMLPGSPRTPGESETQTLDVLVQGATYGFALKVLDEVPNRSGISNFVTLTIPDGVLARAWFGGGENGLQTGDQPETGSDYQSFAKASGVALSGDGFLYVAEFTNNRLSKWTTDGTAVGWIGGGIDGWQTGDAPAGGATFRDLSQCYDVNVDLGGNIYVLDRGNCRVCKWSAQGNAIGWIGGGQDGWRTDDAPGWAKDVKSFSFPNGMALGPDGSIYVADSYNERVCKWDAQGNAIGWIGGGVNGWQTGNAPASGTDMMSFRYPSDVAIDPNGDIVVSDLLNRRVCRWSAAGQALGWIGGGVDGWQTGSGSTHGTDERSFYGNSGLIVVADGTIYVTDQLNSRVSKWSRDGTALGWIGAGGPGWKTGSDLAGGTDLSSFINPRNLVSDGQGTLYIADEIRVCVWSE
jgi:NHL repeat